MNKVISWAFAVALICGLNVFTSCKSDDSQVSPVESQERLELEAALSRSLNEASKDTRFDVGKDVLKNLTEIVANMNDEALKELRNEIIYTVLNNADLVFFEKLSEEEKAVVHKCLVERFDLTEEDFNILVGFMVVDAYKVFGHMKVTFKDGQVVVGKGDDFTIENIDKDGGSTSLTMKFNNEGDGVRFFMTRVSDITPICIQFPEQVEVTMKTADGKELDGTLSLSSKSAFQYISFRDDEWHATVSLASSFDGHHDNYDVYFNHSTNRTLDVDMDIIYDGNEQFNLTVRGDQDPVINIQQLTSLNSNSTFADLLSVFEGGSIDEFEAVVYNEIVINGQVNDVSDCMDALADIHRLYGTNPDFSLVDTYTQRLNEDVDFTFSLKGHSTKADGSFVTYKEMLDREEYLPHVALQFPGESAPIVILDRMSEQDKVNCRLLIDQIKTLGTEARNLLSTLREKIKVVNSLDE
jgi:hypothetical protein